MVGQFSTHRARRLVAACMFLCVSSPAGAQLISDMADALVALSPTRQQTIVVDGRAQIVIDTQTTELIADEFSGVVAQGFSPDADMEGLIRFRGDGRTATTWRALAFVRSATDGAFVAIYDDDLERRNLGFDLRFTLDPDTASEFVLLGAGVFAGRPSPERAVPRRNDATPRREAMDPTGVLAPSTPELISREEWGAQLYGGNLSPLRATAVGTITIHHAGGYRATTKEEGLSQVRAIQELHKKKQGWADIGYHFIMDIEGRFYQGRPFFERGKSFAKAPQLAQGAHVLEYNLGNIGIAVLGCHHPGTECRNRPDYLGSAAVTSLVHMITYLALNYGITPEYILGHRDLANTLCPGDGIHGLLASIRKHVREALRVDGA